MKIPTVAFLLILALPPVAPGRDGIVRRPV